LKNTTRALVGVTLTLLVGKDMEPINKTSDTYTQRFLSGTNGKGNQEISGKHRLSTKLDIKVKS